MNGSRMLNFGASLIDMDEQWKHEIDIFFRRLRNNDVEVIDGSIYAVYDERNNGTRCYSSGEVYGGTLNKGYLFE